MKRAVHRGDNSEWAVKIIDKARLDSEDEAALKVEVAILQQVDHPNIVQLKQIFDCPRQFYMVMEIMTVCVSTCVAGVSLLPCLADWDVTCVRQGGELFDRIVAREKYTEADARAVVAKLAAAIEYCHELGIVHRDLKPENLLYSSEEDDAEIKIADFGLAKLLKESDMMATACGTPGYVGALARLAAGAFVARVCVSACVVWRQPHAVVFVDAAPEILSGGPYTDKVDLWSLGVITYILCVRLAAPLLLLLYCVVTLASPRVQVVWLPTVLRRQQRSAVCANQGWVV